MAAAVARWVFAFNQDGRAYPATGRRLASAPGGEPKVSNGNGVLSDKSRLSLPITLAVTVVVSLVSGAVSATTAAYSLRDRCLDEVKLEVAAASALMRAERTADLRFYLEKETFSDWKQKERIRQDQQFYTLLNAIERLRATSR